MAQVDLSKIAEDAKELEKTAGNASFLTFKDGETLVRFLPAYSDELVGRPYIEVYQHWITLPGRKNSIPVYCNCRPEPFGDGRCLFCEKYTELIKAGDKNASDWSPQRRFMWNAMDPNKLHEGPKLCQVPTMLQRQILGIMMNREYGDITALEGGTIVTVRREGTGRDGTQYFATPGRLQHTLPLEHLKNGLLDLKACVKHHTYEEQEELLAGKQVDTRGTTPQLASSPLTQTQRPTYAPDDFGPPVGGQYAPGKTVPVCYSDSDIFRADSPACQKCAVFIPCGNRLKDPEGAKKHDAQPVATAPVKAPSPAE